MVTIEDIKVFYQRNISQSRQTPQESSHRIPIIESWIGLEKAGRPIIKGRLYGHPHHSVGAKIMTSTIHGYFAGAGHVYVKTSHSLYELGQPCHELGFSKEISDHQHLEQVTIWNE